MTVHLGKTNIGKTAAGTPTLIADVIDDTTGKSVGSLQFGAYHAAATPTPTPTPTPAPTGTLPSPVGPAAPVTPPTNLPKPASTYSGQKMSASACMKYAWDAGFRDPTDLQIVVAISAAESSLDAGGCRNWHPEYGVRPNSETMLVFPPDRARLHADRGPWQISSHWYPQYTDAMCDDPATAARIVKLIKESHSDGWGQWDTYDSGAYKSVGPSLSTVQAFINGPH